MYVNNQQRMSAIMNHTESEFDFKEPLSPTTPRTQSRVGSTHSLSRVSTVRGLTPPPQVKSAYGLMGSVGIVVTIIVFFADLATDVYLIFTSWSQAEYEPNFYHQRRKQNMFKITLLIVIVPIFIINVFSFFWYMQNKHILGDYRLFHVKNKFQKCVCVLLHLLFIGHLSRYFDTLHYGKKIKKYYHARPRVGSKGNLQMGSRASSQLGGSRGSIQLGSRGSIHRINTDELEIDTRSLGVLTRDTAILDLMYNFLKNVPQLVFQIILLYRSSYSINENSDALTVLSQILKIFIGLFYTSWSLVTYQDELRQESPGKVYLTCGAAVACLIWRACLAGSRIISIASMAALKIDGEGGLVKVYSDNAPRGAVVGFPAITSFVLIGHWILMILWIHSQKTTFCHTERSSRSFLEFFYNICMGYVEVFCYLNLKSSPSRRRMIFFYSLIFAENTAFMVIWYLQLITKDVWLRVIVVFSVEALFVMGLSCAIGYFAFLHPSHEKYERSSDTRSEAQTELTWR